MVMTLTNLIWGMGIVQVGVDELEDSHYANLSPYLFKDAQKKDNFDINDVYHEENEKLNCDNDIDGDEIDDLCYMCAVVKEIK